MNSRLFSGALLLVTMTACSSTEQLFVNPYPPVDNRKVLQQYFQPKEPVIQAGDKMTLSIWGHEELSVGSVNSSFNSNEATGKWLVVDNDGEVNLPQVGRVMVAGFDIKEVNYMLEDKYSHLLKDPIINVKVLNHFVTVLGEVNKPGRYQLDNEMMSLVQLIGEAEGLSRYAKGDHVRVIRSVGNETIELKVDMTDLVTFTEFNVFMQPDDLIYIGANKRKDSDDRLRRATTITGILTGVAVVVSIFAK